MASKGSKVPILFGALLWFLQTAAFVLLLSGVASMQNDCGSAGANDFRAMGVVGYLAPVSCDVFFSFDWFITFFQFFVWALVAIFLFSNQYHIARSMLTSLLSIASVLVMLTANTWYRAFDAGGDAGAGLLSSSFNSRAKVMFSGALIGAIANLSLIILLGLETEKKSDSGTSKGEQASGAAESNV